MKHTTAGTLGLMSAALGCGVLYRFPPERFSFYPVCPIHQGTGLLCPGCGATRALAALTHGHVGEALRDNALFVGLLPLVVCWVLVSYVRVLRGRDGVRVPPVVIAGLCGVAVCFGVWRNIV